jgi:NAD-dependent DNA ligase
MSELICLSKDDCGLLAARFGEHGNSQRRILEALEEAAAEKEFARMCALRQLEMHFSVDLGMVCYHFMHRNDKNTHPIQRAVMNYVAEWGFDVNAREELHVRIDRVKEVRDIVEDGRLAERA